MKKLTNSYLTELSESELVCVNGGETKTQKHERWARACMQCHIGGSIFQSIGHLCIAIFG